MTPDALLYVMAGAVVVSATALLFQAALLLALYRAAKEIRDQVTGIAAHAESFVHTAERTLEQSRKQVTEVAAKTNEVLTLAHKQLVRVDDVLGEATYRARVQMERVELILDDYSNRLKDALVLVDNGVIRPLRETVAVAVGVRTALRHLFGGRRLTPERATSDEEMFI